MPQSLLKCSAIETLHHLQTVRLWYLYLLITGLDYLIWSQEIIEQESQDISILSSSSWNFLSIVDLHTTENIYYRVFMEKLVFKFYSEGKVKCRPKLQAWIRMHNAEAVLDKYFSAIYYKLKHGQKLSVQLWNLLAQLLKYVYPIKQLYKQLALTFHITLKRLMSLYSI